MVVKNLKRRLCPLELHVNISFIDMFLWSKFVLVFECPTESRPILYYTLKYEVQPQNRLNIRKSISVG